QRVTVPGARLVDGTLTPSHIEAAVTADRPGPEYHLSPVGRLALPGFTGTPRDEKFYGELAQGTSGGFIGETAVPTTADIEAAKGKVGELLGTALRAELLANIPEGFVIVDGASEVTLARVNVNEATDEDGRFSVFGGATVAALAFREADMRNLLQEVSGKEHPLLVFHKLDLEYANVRANLKDGTVTFAVRAAADLAHPFSAEDFEASVLGRSVKEVKALIAGKEGIGGVAVSLRPFWRRSIPQNPERVTVGVE
ncbi:MAG: hypothetical protein HY436_01875, partial [Candidatus Liptonbacteria bacterium]|nr:hypothetical protein [Candidatus Liptonbacteria bacterium]